MNRWNLMGIAVAINLVCAMVSLGAAMRSLGDARASVAASERYVAATRSAIVAGELWRTAYQETQDDLLCRVGEPDPEPDGK